jgi:acetylornithine/succinyldiaminopimelate/putrescine aminotransferase
VPGLRQLFLQHVAQTSEFPLSLEIERAQGSFLFDTQGKSYLDLISGIGVSALGHCHPEVVNAVHEQSSRYMHTLVYGEYILSPQVNLARELAELLPPHLSSVYFVNSGAEATEGAMKLAKRFTGRKEIIACKNAYHGSTQGAASLMNPTTFTSAFLPLLPGIRHIEFNCEMCLEKITTSTACVIIETVQGESGVRLPNPQYLKKLRERCQETGALLILDEIQCGYGRTGSFFTFEKYDIVPDILLLAKGMGGGMPIGAFISSPEIMKVLSRQPVLGHITTFGGHPVSCAASLATTKVLRRENYIQEAQQKGDLIRQKLNHKDILEIRSAGLMMAVELESFERLQKVIKACLERGLVTDWFLFNDRSMRIAPPLNISIQEIEWACDVISEALDQTS